MDESITTRNPRLQKVAEGVNWLMTVSHEASVVAGWWNEGPITRELIAVKIALIHSEISEALEGARKNLPDDHLPGRSMVEVELADALIRIGDLAGALNLDLGGAVAEKIHYNASRVDHKLEARKEQHGKAF